MPEKINYKKNMREIPFINKKSLFRLFLLKLKFTAVEYFHSKSTTKQTKTHLLG